MHVSSSASARGLDFLFRDSAAGTQSAFFDFAELLNQHSAHHTRWGKRISTVANCFELLKDNASKQRLLEFWQEISETWLYKSIELNA